MPALVIPSHCETLIRQTLSESTVSDVTLTNESVRSNANLTLCRSLALEAGHHDFFCLSDAEASHWLGYKLHVTRQHNHLDRLRGWRRADCNLWFRSRHCTHESQNMISTQVIICGVCEINDTNINISPGPPISSTVSATIKSSSGASTTSVSATCGSATAQGRRMDKCNPLIEDHQGMDRTIALPAAKSLTLNIS